MPDDPTLLCIRDLLQSAQLLCGGRHKVLSYLVGMALEEAADISENRQLLSHGEPVPEDVRSLAVSLVGLAHADGARGQCQRSTSIRSRDVGS